MTSFELRKQFLSFFKKNNHIVVPSSSLIPDDPSVLLTSAGMQQFKSYYTGAADPMVSPHLSMKGKPIGGVNVVSIQKSFRTSDIDEVGDESHLTFFEMMGNFSFGGYFKEEAIKYAKEFLDSIDITIDYVTVFKGDKDVPKDEESIKIWDELGFSQEKGNLKLENKEENFWGPTGSEGPCGPTTEIFVNGVEVWNIVFNEYYCGADGKLTKLKKSGIDTGMGLERLSMVSQEKKIIFETDLFKPIADAVPSSLDERVKRVCADHARSIVFLVGDGIRPSNKEAGYILRRLMRRVLVYENLYTDDGYDTLPLLKKAVEMFSEFYSEIKEDDIISVFSQEKTKFQTTLAKGLKELERVDSLDAKSAFRLYESFGLPYEIIKELGGKKAESLVQEDFDEQLDKHREISRAGQERKFGGHGLLLDTGELKAADEEELKIVTRLHTATHLLQAALREVLGNEVEQAGSDITVERTRFDFTFERRLTDEEIQAVEDLVNKAIKDNLKVEEKEMSYQDAIKTQALHFAKEKYPATVKVYSMGTFSKELCGGPHVSQTKEIGKFKIAKQESVAAGVRRIRGIIEEA